MRAMLATALFLGFAVIAPSAVRADETDISIVLDELTPLLPQPGRKLTLTGRVVNLGSENISNARLELRVSEQPLASRAAAAQIAADVLPATRSIQDARVTFEETIAPRGQGPFSITVALNDMDLQGDGTYAISIVLTGSTSAAANVAASLHTYLPWFPRGELGQRTYTPIKVVWLWPFVDWPARSASGTLLDERTPLELSSGGRLDALATIAQSHPRVVSPIADPALLQTAAAMTTGYQVIRDGRVVIGDRGEAANTWLTTLRDISGEPMWVMPYADIDASASQRAELDTEVVRSVTQSGSVAQRSFGEEVQPGLYWAPFGRLDSPTANLLSSAGVSTVILSASALPDEQPITPTGRATLGTSLGALDAVLIDPTLATLLTTPQQSTSEVLLARQRFLAETALIATEVTEETDVRTIVIAPRNVRWNPNPDFINPLLRASLRSAWMTPTSLDALLAALPPGIPRDRAGYGDRARAAELPEQYLTQVRRVAQRIELFSSILDNPGGTTEPFAEALLRAQSSAWRSEPETGVTLLRSIRTEINDVIGQVRVLSTGNITFSGDVGRVPITIANDLDQSVTVGLRLVGNPTARISAQDVTEIRIEAGRKASVDVDARVIGGEPLNVNVQLLTPENQVYGTPTTIQVNSTAYARAASWVVIAAFIALTLFVVVGVTRRIHQARKSSTAI